METYKINMLELSKKEQAELIRVMKYTDYATTLRSHLVTGPVGIVIYTAIVFMIFVVLGALFLPLMILAPLVAIVLPLKITASNKRWRKLLPAEADGKLVELTNVWSTGK